MPSSISHRSRANWPALLAGLGIPHAGHAPPHITLGYTCGSWALALDCAEVDGLHEARHEHVVDLGRTREEALRRLDTLIAAGRRKLGPDADSHRPRTFTVRAVLASVAVAAFLLARCAGQPCLARLDAPECRWVLERSLPWDTDTDDSAVRHAPGGGL